MSDFEEEISGKAEVPYYRDLDLEAMKYTLSTRKGRRVIYSLLGVCHYGRTAFGGTNEITNFQCGKQAVGEHIIGLLNLTNPEAFSLMVKEANEDAQNDRRTSTSDDNTSTSSDGAFSEPDAGTSQPA